MHINYNCLKTIQLHLKKNIKNIPFQMNIPVDPIIESRTRPKN